MMDFVSSVALFVIPRWVKVALIALLAGLMVLYLAVTAMGIYDADRPGWLEAGAYLFGVLLPFLIIALLVGFTQSGVEALVGRNAYFLRRTIPQLTVLFADPPGGFEDAHGKHRAPLASPPPVRIQCAGNMGLAGYIVTIEPEFARRLDDFPRTRTLHFRLELNATKANAVILVPEEKAAKPATELFPLALRGAETEGYTLLHEYWPETRLGRRYKSIVAVRRLDQDFLVNPLKRLDFAHDLIVMLRAMIQENPEVFVEEQEPASSPLN